MIRIMSTITAAQSLNQTPEHCPPEHHQPRTVPQLANTICSPCAQEKSLRTNFISYFVYIWFFSPPQPSKDVLHAAESQKKQFPCFYTHTHTRTHARTHTHTHTHTHTKATGFVCLFKVTVIFPPFIWSSNESAKSG